MDLNSKRNRNMLLAIPLMLGLALPALAQVTPSNPVEKGGTSRVELNKTCGVQGRSCGGRKQAMGGMRLAKMHRFHRGLGLGFLRGEYKLTDGQSEKIVAIKDQFLSQAKPKISDLISSKRKMRELMSQPNVDKQQLLSLQNEVNADRDSLSNLKLENRLDELNVLTDQQREQLHKKFLEHAVRRA